MFDENEKNDELFGKQEDFNENVNNDSNVVAKNEDIIDKNNDSENVVNNDTNRESSASNNNDGQYRLNREYYQNQESASTNTRDTGYTSYNTQNNSEGTYSSYNSTSSGTYNYSGSYNSGNNTAGNSNKTNRKPNKGNNSLVKKIGLVAASAAVFGLVAGAGFVTVVTISDKVSDKEKIVSQVELNDEETKTNDTPVVDSNSSSAGNAGTVNTTNLSTTVTDVSDVVEAVMPSVVSITNLSVSEITVPSFWGQQGGTYEQEYESCGSGIIIGENDTELLIATNNHVVADATTLSVGFVDDAVVEAKVKGTDSDMDLAVIAVALEDIPEETLSKIKVAEIGDSESLKVGEAAIAIGNALGYGQSVTTGVISAIDREVTVDSVTNELIQTDAAINPGNSGGALLNMRGQLIGINSVKYSSEEVEGMGYAIPISDAMPIISELLTKETRELVDEAEAGYIGISGVDVSQEAASMYNMPSGVYVAQVMEDSAAEKAGLKKGDIITKFDGNSIKSMEDLQGILQYYAAGDTVDMTIQSANNGEYEESKISITLGKKVN